MVHLQVKDILKSMNILFREEQTESERLNYTHR